MTSFSCPNQSTTSSWHRLAHWRRCSTDSRRHRLLNQELQFWGTLLLLQYHWHLHTFLKRFFQCGYDDWSLLRLPLAQWSSLVLLAHPPAGAFSAVIFSEGSHWWGFYGFAVLCSIISVIPATIVNSMSKKRQYRTY